MYSFELKRNLKKSKDVAEKIEDCTLYKLAISDFFIYVSTSAPKLEIFFSKKKLPINNRTYQQKLQ